jgi:hypothetical protein
VCITLSSTCGGAPLSRLGVARTESVVLDDVANLLCLLGARTPYMGIKKIGARHELREGFGVMVYI